MQKAKIYDNAVTIEEYRLETIQHALKLHQKGLLRRLPRTPLTVLREDYGFQGRRVAQGLVFVEDLIRRHSYKVAALTFANEVRKNLGYPPVRDFVPGLRMTSQSCSLARTIVKDMKVNFKCHVNPGSVRILNDGYSLRRYPHPVQVSEFVMKFDAGEYPELVAHE